MATQRLLLLALIFTVFTVVTYCRPMIDTSDIVKDIREIENILNEGDTGSDDETDDENDDTTDSKDSEEEEEEDKGDSASNEDSDAVAKDTNSSVSDVLTNTTTADVISNNTAQDSANSNLTTTTNSTVDDTSISNDTTAHGTLYTSENPGNTEAPVAPATAVSSDAPGKVAASIAPANAEPSDAPATTETADASEASGAGSIENAGATETPDNAASATETLKQTEDAAKVVTSATPEKAAVSEGAAVGAAEGSGAGATETAGKASATETPEKAGATDTPVKAEATETPDKPEASATPEKAEATDAPVKAAATEDPVKPDASATPDKAAATDASETATPDSSEAPVNATKAIDTTRKDKIGIGQRLTSEQKDTPEVPVAKNVEAATPSPDESAPKPNEFATIKMNDSPHKDTKEDSDVAAYSPHKDAKADSDVAAYSPHKDTKEDSAAAASASSSSKTTDITVDSPQEMAAAMSAPSNESNAPEVDHQLPAAANKIVSPSTTTSHSGSKTTESKEAPSDVDVTQHENVVADKTTEAEDTENENDEEDESENLSNDNKTASSVETPEYSPEDDSVESDTAADQTDSKSENIENISEEDRVKMFFISPYEKDEPFRSSSAYNGVENARTRQILTYPAVSGQGWGNSHQWGPSHIWNSDYPYYAYGYSWGCGNHDDGHGHVTMKKSNIESSSKSDKKKKHHKSKSGKNKKEKAKKSESTKKTDWICRDYMLVPATPQGPLLDADVGGYIQRGFARHTIGPYINNKDIACHDEDQQCKQRQVIGSMAGGSLFGDGMGGLGMGFPGVPGIHAGLSGYNEMGGFGDHGCHGGGCHGACHGGGCGGGGPAVGYGGGYGGVIGGGGGIVGRFIDNNEGSTPTFWGEQPSYAGEEENSVKKSQRPKNAYFNEMGNQGYELAGITHHPRGSFRNSQFNEGFGEPVSSAPESQNFFGGQAIGHAPGFGVAREQGNMNWGGPDVPANGARFMGGGYHDNYFGGKEPSSTNYKEPLGANDYGVGRTVHSIMDAEAQGKLGLTGKISINGIHKNFAFKSKIGKHKNHKERTGTTRQDIAMPDEQAMMEITKQRQLIGSLGASTLFADNVGGMGLGHPGVPGMSSGVAGIPGEYGGTGGYSHGWNGHDQPGLNPHGFRHYAFGNRELEREQGHESLYTPEPPQTESAHSRTQIHNAHNHREVSENTEPKKHMMTHQNDDFESQRRDDISPYNAIEAKNDDETDTSAQAHILTAQVQPNLNTRPLDTHSITYSNSVDQRFAAGLTEREKALVQEDDERSISTLRSKAIDDDSPEDATVVHDLHDYRMEQQQNVIRPAETKVVGSSTFVGNQVVGNPVIGNPVVGNQVVGNPVAFGNLPVIKKPTVELGVEPTSVEGYIVPPQTAGATALHAYPANAPSLHTSTSVTPKPTEVALNEAPATTVATSVSQIKKVAKAAKQVVVTEGSQQLPQESIIVSNVNDTGADTADTAVEGKGELVDDSTQPIEAKEEVTTTQQPIEAKEGDVIATQPIEAKQEVVKTQSIQGKEEAVEAKNNPENPTKEAKEEVIEQVQEAPDQVEAKDDVAEEKPVANVVATNEVQKVVKTPVGNVATVPTEAKSDAPAPIEAKGDATIEATTQNNGIESEAHLVEAKSPLEMQSQSLRPTAKVQMIRARPLKAQNEAIAVPVEAKVDEIKALASDPNRFEVTRVGPVDAVPVNTITKEVYPTETKDDDGETANNLADRIVNDVEEGNLGTVVKEKPDLQVMRGDERLSDGEKKELIAGLQAQTKDANDEANRIAAMLSNKGSVTSHYVKQYGGETAEKDDDVNLRSNVKSPHLESAKTRNKENKSTLSLHEKRVKQITSASRSALPHNKNISETFILPYNEHTAADERSTVVVKYMKPVKVHQPQNRAPPHVIDATGEEKGKKGASKSMISKNPANTVGSKMSEIQKLVHDVSNSIKKTSKKLKNLGENGGKRQITPAFTPVVSEPAAVPDIRYPVPSADRYPLGAGYIWPSANYGHQLGGPFAWSKSSTPAAETKGSKAKTEKTKTTKSKLGKKKGEKAKVVAKKHEKATKEKSVHAKKERRSIEKSEKKKEKTGTKRQFLTRPSSYGERNGGEAYQAYHGGMPIYGSGMGYPMSHGASFTGHAGSQRAFTRHFHPMGDGGYSRDVVGGYPSYHGGYGHRLRASHSYLPSLSGRYSNFANHEASGGGFAGAPPMTLHHSGMYGGPGGPIGGPGGFDGGIRGGMMGARDAGAIMAAGHDGGGLMGPPHDGGGMMGAHDGGAIMVAHDGGAIMGGHDLGGQGYALGGHGGPPDGGFGGLPPGLGMGGGFPHGLGGGVIEDHQGGIPDGSQGLPHGYGGGGGGGGVGHSMQFAMPPDDTHGGYIRHNGGGGGGGGFADALGGPVPGGFENGAGTISGGMGGVGAGVNGLVSGGTISGSLDQGFAPGPPHSVDGGYGGGGGGGDHMAGFTRQTLDAQQPEQQSGDPSSFAPMMHNQMSPGMMPPMVPEPQQAMFSPNEHSWESESNVKMRRDLTYGFKHNKITDKSGENYKRTKHSHHKGKQNHHAGTKKDSMGTKKDWSYTPIPDNAFYSKSKSNANKRTPVNEINIDACGDIDPTGKRTMSCSTFSPDINKNIRGVDINHAVRNVAEPGSSNIGAMRTNAVYENSPTTVSAVDTTVDPTSPLVQYPQSTNVVHTITRVPVNPISHVPVNPLHLTAPQQNINGVSYGSVSVLGDRILGDDKSNFDEFARNDALVGRNEESLAMKNGGVIMMTPPPPPPTPLVNTPNAQPVNINTIKNKKLVPSTQKVYPVNTISKLSTKILRNPLTKNQPQKILNVYPSNNVAIMKSPVVLTSMKLTHYSIKNTTLVPINTPKNKDLRTSGVKPNLIVSSNPVEPVDNEMVNGKDSGLNVNDPLQVEGKEPDVEAKVPETEKYDPGVEAKEPEVEAKETEIEAKEPEQVSNNILPAIEAKEPEDPNAPKAEAYNPDVEAKEPEVEAKGTEVEAKEPEIEAKGPQIEAKGTEFESEAEEPKVEAKGAAIEVKGPELEAKEPEIEAKEPEIEAKEPDVEAKEIDQAKEIEDEREPNAIAKAPGAEAYEPGVQEKDPSVEAKETEVEAKEPDSEAKEPEVIEGKQPEFIEPPNVEAKVSTIDPKVPPAVEAYESRIEAKEPEIEAKEPQFTTSSQETSDEDESNCLKVAQASGIKEPYECVHVNNVNKDALRNDPAIIHKISSKENKTLLIKDKLVAKYPTKKLLRGAKNIPVIQVGGGQPARPLNYMIQIHGRNVPSGKVSPKGRRVNQRIIVNKNGRHVKETPNDIKCFSSKLNQKIAESKQDSREKETASDIKCIKEGDGVDPANGRHVIKNVRCYNVKGNPDEKAITRYIDSCFLDFYKVVVNLESGGIGERQPIRNFQYFIIDKKERKFDVAGLNEKAVTRSKVSKNQKEKKSPHHKTHKRGKHKYKKHKDIVLQLVPYAKKELEWD